jgi:predicted glycoside hydrolase/deacetylase ChbG (UPF0249 family)
VTGARRLIVNADDFGLSEGVNRGVIEAHERGIVTAASLMVRGDAATEAAAYARAHRSLDVGLHIDIGEWKLDRGEWVAIYRRVDPDDRDAVAVEIRAQLERFRALVGSDPTHLDSHQHVHSREPAGSIARQLATKIGAPLRHASAIGYLGDFYGQDADGTPLDGRLTVESMIRLIRGLPAGTTELACHPGYADDLPTMYRSERAIEAAVLCDPRVRRAIDDERIDLTRFSQLAAAPGPR